MRVRFDGGAPLAAALIWPAEVPAEVLELQVGDVAIVEVTGRFVMVERVEDQATGPACPAAPASSVRPKEPAWLSEPGCELLAAWARQLVGGEAIHVTMARPSAASFLWSVVGRAQRPDGQVTAAASAVALAPERAQRRALELAAWLRGALGLVNV